MTGRVVPSQAVTTQRSTLQYFKTSPKIIRAAVILYVRFRLSHGNVEDLPHERGVDISHEGAVRLMRTRGRFPSPRW